MNEPISGYAVTEETDERKCPGCGGEIWVDVRPNDVHVMCRACKIGSLPKANVDEAFQSYIQIHFAPNRARRDNDDKPRYSLIDFAGMGDLINVLEYGADKYGRDNWKKGLTVTSILDSMLRHITAYLGGEDTDSESGLPHVGHIYANAMFLARHAGNPDLDDRGKE